MAIITETKDLSSIDLGRIVPTTEKDAFTKIKEMLKAANPGKDEYVDALFADGVSVDVTTNIYLDSFIRDEATHSYDYDTTFKGEENREKRERVKNGALARKPSVNIKVTDNEQNRAKYKNSMRSSGIDFEYTPISLVSVLTALGFEREYSWDQMDAVKAKLDELMTNDQGRNEYYVMDSTNQDSTIRTIVVERINAGVWSIGQGSASYDKLNRILALCTTYDDSTARFRLNRDDFPELFFVITAERAGVADEDKIGDETNPGNSGTLNQNDIVKP